MFIMANKLGLNYFSRNQVWMKSGFLFTNDNF